MHVGCIDTRPDVDRDTWNLFMSQAPYMEDSEISLFSATCVEVVCQWGSNPGQQHHLWNASSQLCSAHHRDSPL